MLTIRLQRSGKKNRPHFRVVLIDSKRASKSGAFLEALGWRDPIRKETQLKADRIKHWLSKGVKTSDTVYNMLVTAGIVVGSKKQVHSRKPSKKKAAKASVFGEAEKATEKNKTQAVEEKVAPIDILTPAAEAQQKTAAGEKEQEEMLEKSKTETSAAIQEEKTGEIKSEKPLGAAERNKK